MMSIKKILNKKNKNVIFYLGGDLLAKILPFLFIPLLTKYLTPEQYGNISIFNIGVEIFVIIIIMGGNSYYKVEYLNFKSPIDALYNILYNISLVFIAVLAISAPLYYVADNVFIFKILPLIIFCAYLQSIFYLYISYYQCNEKALVVGCVNLIFSLANSILMVYLLICWKINESARYWSFCLALVLSVTIIAIYLGRKHKIKFNKEINYELFKFGVGSFPHAISWWARGGMDRLLIGWFLSVSTLGIYSLAMQLTSLMPIFCNAVNQALIPGIIRELTEGKPKQARVVLLKAVGAVTLVCVLAAVMFSLVLKYFLDQRYLSALEYVPYMMITFSFQSVVILFSNILYYYKQVKYLSAITFGPSCLHLCLATLMLHYGYSAYSVIISSAITFFIAAALVLRKAMILTERVD